MGHVYHVNLHTFLPAGLKSIMGWISKHSSIIYWPLITFKNTNCLAKNIGQWFLSVKKNDFHTFSLQLPTSLWFHYYLLSVVYLSASCIALTTNTWIKTLCSPGVSNLGHFNSRNSPTSHEFWELTSTGLEAAKVGHSRSSPFHKNLNSLHQSQGLCFGPEVGYL